MLEIKEFNKIIVANWKLNGSNDFLEAFFEELDLKDLNSDTCGVICHPITYIQNCYSKLQTLYLGAQNCSKFKEQAKAKRAADEEYYKRLEELIDALANCSVYNCTD